MDFPDLESCLLLLQQQQQQPLELRGRKLKLDWATAELREAYGTGGTALGGSGGRQSKDPKCEALTCVLVVAFVADAATAVLPLRSCNLFSLPCLFRGAWNNKAGDKGWQGSGGSN